MFCEKCGKPVGDFEKFCGNCGAPILPLETVPVSSEPTESVSVEAEAKEPAVAPAVPQVQEAPIAPAIPVDDQNNSGKKPKKKKAPWIIAACAALAAVAVVICVISSESLGNFFRRNFSSPEKYYQYVEGNTVSAMAGICGVYYEALIMDLLGTGDRSIDAELAIELGERGKELIEQLELADENLTWLTNLSMGVGYTLKESLLGYDISFGLNKSDILSVKTITDLEGGTIYLQVPELTEDYIGVDLDEFTDGYGIDIFESYQEMQETYAAVRKSMPDTKEVVKLLQKYLKLALSGVSDVEKSTKTLRVGGVQQKCTELEVTFDGKSLSKILKAVLKEIPKDKDLKKLFVSTMDNLPAMDGGWSVDGEDAWDEFIGEVEELLDNLDELEDLDEVLVMKVYVDGKGNIAGRVIELVEDGETYGKVSVLMPRKGSRFGYEFSVEPDYGTKIALTGSGKVSGNNLTGDYVLEVMGMSVLDVKVSGLDTKQLQQGYLNCSVTITPSGSFLTRAMSYNGISLTDIQLTLDFQSSKNFDKLALGLFCDEEEMVSAVLSVESGDGSGMSVPDAGKTVFVEETNDLQGWLDGIEWDKFIENLDKAGLPDEIVDTVEDIAGILAGKGLLEGLYGLDDDYLYDGYFYDYDDDYYGDDHYGDDHYGGDTYNGGLWGNVDSLEQLLQSDEWQNELRSWDDTEEEIGITINTVADGNVLVFECYLADDELYNAFGEDEGALMAGFFLATLRDSDFMEIFEEEYGISLDGVRCVVYRADGTEIYRDEIN